MNNIWKEVTKGKYIGTINGEEYPIILIDYQSGLEEDNVTFLVQDGIFKKSSIRKEDWENEKRRLTEKFGFEPTEEFLLLSLAEFQLDGFFGDIDGLKEMNRYLSMVGIEPLQVSIKENPTLTQWQKVDEDRFIKRVNSKEYKVIKAYHFNDITIGKRFIKEHYSLYIYDWDIRYFGTNLETIQQFVEENGREPKDDMEFVIFEVNQVGSSAADELKDFETLEELNHYLKTEFDIQNQIEELKYV